jgi:hypothetical protein
LTIACGLNLDTVVATKQHDQNHDNDKQPDQTMTAAAIIAAVVAPIAAPAAEQEDENDDQKDEAHVVNLASSEFDPNLRQLIRGQMIEFHPAGEIHCRWE